MPTDKAPDKAVEHDLGELEAVLRRQLALHEQLLPLLRAQRQALARADRRRLTQLCQEENAVIQAISELEKRRLTLVAQLTLAVEPQAAQPLRLRDLAQRLPEPVRGRLMALRQQVYQRMEEASRETGVARHATERLLRHMQGLIQTIGTAVTGVATYNRAGARPKAATAISTFNTTA